MEYIVDKFSNLHSSKYSRGKAKYKIGNLIEKDIA